MKRVGELCVQWGLSADAEQKFAALLDWLTEMALAKEITVQREGQPLTDPAAIREALAPALEQALAGLAASSLLAG